MDTANCDRYIMTSSASVYQKHRNTVEEDFNPLTYPLRWCSRGDFSYDEIKRQAECALFGQYPKQNACAVRFPLVIGEDDYTKRLYFYIEHIIKGVPMFVDNAENQMGFVRSDEAGRFLAFLAENDYVGVINGCNSGTISLQEIISYVEDQTGAKAIFAQDGEEAPYNGAIEYSINTDRAEHLEFVFTPLSSWIYELLDYYMEQVKQKI